MANTRRQCHICKRRRPITELRIVGIQARCVTECAPDKPVTYRRKCTCGERFITTDSRARYCSESCQRQRRHVVALTCRWCERSFLGDAASRRFCSRSCAAKWRVEHSPPSKSDRPKTGRLVACEHCGVKVYCRPSMVARKRFCSRKCAEAARRADDRVLFVGRADNSGERNGRYRHGKSSGKTHHKARTRQDVVLRDGDWCLLCGAPPRGLHLHRLVYGSQGGTYEPGNCVQLCWLHHQLVHTSKRIWYPILARYVTVRNAGVDRRTAWAELRVQALRAIDSQTAKFGSLPNWDRAADICRDELADVNLPEPPHEEHCVDWAYAERLYREGKSTIEVGRIIGRHSSQVSRRLRSRGVPMRPASGRTAA